MVGISPSVPGKRSLPVWVTGSSSEPGAKPGMSSSDSVYGVGASAVVEMLPPNCSAHAVEAVVVDVVVLKTGNLRLVIFGGILLEDGAAAWVHKGSC